MELLMETVNSSNKRSHTDKILVNSHFTGAAMC